MPVDFHLSPAEEGIRKAAAGFAAGPLKDARKTYMRYQHHQERFQSTRPIYHQAVAGGLIKGQIPDHLGGSGGSLIEAAILVEEMYTVEPAASLTIFSTGLGLTPMNLTGKPEHKEFLAPFLSGEGEPLASMVFSEPGGVANYLEKGALGLVTTATLEGDEWVLNGEKVRTKLSCKRFHAANDLAFRTADIRRRSGPPTALAGTSKAQTFNASSAGLRPPAPMTLPTRS